MGKDLGLVGGNKWFTGTGITGQSTTPTVYEDSEVDYAIPSDLYLNEETSDVYQCETEGDAETATWVFLTNIRGAMPELVNNLKSTAINKALTANMGRKLNEKILESGVYPKEVVVAILEKAYVAEIEIDNIDGTILLNTEDQEVQYSVTETGTTETRTVSIDIDTETGFEEAGAILTNVSFDGNIYVVKLYDDNANIIFDFEASLWNEVNNALEQVSLSGYITDGSETLREGIISKFISGIKNVVYPITHAKAVWFDKTNDKTVYDEISEINEHFSHIGMVIHSTTLDTEAKVKAIYGSNTQWISLSGYVLRGATSGVIPNHNAKDLGSDTHTITESEMPSHRHSVSRAQLAESAGSHTHKFQASASGTGTNYWQPQLAYGLSKNQAYTETDGAHTHYISAHNTNYTGSGSEMSIIPNEKNVYIWERVG